MKKYWPFLLILGVSILFFYKTFFLFQTPFPGDLLVSEYAPWKYESYLGYNPGSYPNKAQYFDVIRQLYPWKTLAIDQFLSGSIPLWNPYNFAGSPLLANNQSGVFYPVNLVFALFGKGFAWSLYIFLQPFLACLFMYLFVRSLKLSIQASLIGSVSFGFSLFMSTFLEYGNIGHTILWLPFLLLCVEKISFDKKWSIPLIFGTSFMIFAGHLQIAVSILAICLVYAFVENLKDLKKFIFVLISIALGILVSSIQLLPTFELISNSARAAHAAKTINELFLLQPNQLVLFFAPDIFGNPATRNYLLTDTYPGNAVYIGIIPVLFAVSFLFSRKREGLSRFFLISSVVLLALFVRNPISELIFNLPIFSASSPSNFFFLLGFCLSVLASYGFDQNAKGFRKQLIPIVAVCLMAVFFLLSNLMFQVPTNTKQIIFSFGILIISCFSFLAFRMFKHKYIFLLPFLVLTLDLFYLFIKFNPFVPSSLLYPQTSITSFLKYKTGFDRFIGYKAAEIESNFSTQLRTFSPDGYDPLYPQIYNKYTESTSRSDAKISLSQIRQRNELGVKFVLDRTENASDQTIFTPGTFSPIYSENGWIVYQNDDSLPRAYVKNEDGYFPSKIVSYTPQKVTIDKGKESGTLILSDTFYPGWEAKVDGKVMPITLEDGIYRGVSVSKESREIVFEYKPKSFYNGLVITIISMVGIFVYSFMFLWKKR